LPMLNPFVSFIWNIYLAMMIHNLFGKASRDQYIDGGD